MKAVLLGMKKVNFTDKKTGELIVGTSLYYAYEEEGTVGRACENKFIKNGSLTLPENLTVGCTLSLDFSGKGKLNEISVHSSPTPTSSK